MILDQRLAVSASLEEAWAFLMDIPAVSSCVPGIESMEPLGDDRYQAVMRVKVGSVRIRFEGTITVVERDADARRARLLAEGADRRVGGSVKADVDMRLEQGDDQVEMLVHTDAAILGKLGELGQAVMRRKSEQVMRQFAANMGATLADGESTPGAGQAAPNAASTAEIDRPSEAPSSRWARLRAWLRRLFR